MSQFQTVIITRWACRISNHSMFVDVLVIAKPFAAQDSGTEAIESTRRRRDGPFVFGEISVSFFFRFFPLFRSKVKRTHLASYITTYQ